MELGYSWKIFPDEVEKVFSDVCGNVFIKKWVVPDDFSDVCGKVFIKRWVVPDDFFDVCGNVFIKRWVVTDDLSVVVTSNAAMPMLFYIFFVGCRFVNFIR